MDSGTNRSSVHADEGTPAQVFARLQILRKLDRAINLSARISDIYHVFVHYAVQLLSYDIMSITLLEGQELRVTFVADRGQRATALPVGTILSPNSSNLGWVIKQGQPLLRHDMASATCFFTGEPAPTERIRSSMIIPLRAKRGVIGTWNLGHHDVGAYDPDDLEVAEAMADLLAKVVEKTHLVEQIQQEASERQRADEALRRTLAELEQRVAERTNELSKINSELQQEIAAREQVEQALRESEERYALAARAANDGLWDWNLITNEIYFSARWKATLGYEEADIGRDSEEWFSRIHPEDIDRLRSDMAAHRAGQSPHLHNEHRLLHRDGTYRWVLCQGIVIRDWKGLAQRLVGSQIDVTHRKLLEEQLRYEARHDALTGLSNRMHFMERLDQELEQARASLNDGLAVLFIDLDRFKVINDSLGHLAGDRLLMAIADRLKACIGPHDLVARFGGDEFVILLTHIQAEAEAMELANRLHQAVRQRVDLGEQKIYPTVSIGIIYDKGHYERSENLLRDADIALYEAKAGGRAQYRMFDAAQRARTMTRLRLEADLWEAIDRHEFQVYYQSIVSLTRSERVGVAAALRWQHPNLGLLKPGEFIDVAEETGLISPLSDWVLRSACLQVERWQAAGLGPLRLAVKVSAHQFEQGLLLSRVETVLEETGLAPAMLELELNERITPPQHITCLPILQALKTMGVRLSIAHFGAGTSLSLLRQIEFDSLKIDRSFIETMRPDKATLVSAMISMAHQLGLNVIADGVENETQRATLRAHRCDEIQGSLIGPPLPAAEFIQLFEKEPG